MQISDKEKRFSMIAASAFERASYEINQNSTHRSDINREIMHALSVALLIIGGEFRRLAYGGKADD